MPDHVVDLRLDLLSPCFLGGAHQQPEFRIGSIRGLWRYWYRALYGQGTETTAVVGEQELFGSTAGSQDEEERLGGRGVARLILRAPLPRGDEGLWTRGNPPTGADYLLFSMAMNERKYLKPPLPVNLQLRVTGTQDVFERVAGSLATALAFSGIGARARRMAGAVHAASVEDRPPYFFASPAPGPPSVMARLKDLTGPVLRLPQNASITMQRYHVVAPRWFAAGVFKETFPTWQAALAYVGERLQRFRQCDPGRAGRRQPDYAIAKAALRGQALPEGKTITRAALGLPIQFRFRSERGSVDVRFPDDPVTRDRRDRRGSPLFLTLEKLAQGDLAVVWCVFRSHVSPDGQILIGGREVSAPDHSILDEMLRNPDWKNSHMIVG